MRRMIAILVLSLLVGCFAGCGDDVVTPSNVMVSVENDLVQHKIPSESEEDIQTVSNVSNQTESKNTIENQTESSEKSAPSQAKQSSGGEKNLFADIDIKWPTFTSFADYETWMKADTVTTFAHVKEQFQVYAADSVRSDTYDRPVIGTGNDWMSLKIIECVSNQDESVIHYRYTLNHEANETLTVWNVLAGDVISRSYNHSTAKLDLPAEQRPFDEYFTATYDSIEYSVFHFKEHYITIHWQQFGKKYMAALTDHYDQILEILPLLKMERVSYSNPGDLDSE